MTARYRRVAVALLTASVLTLAACGEGKPGTSIGVARHTTIDFGEVANYSAPRLPEYFDETAAALDSGPPVDDKIATLGRVLFYDMGLSTNDRVSCATCHQQKFGFTDPMRFSNGISNAATTDAHSMRLANLRYWQPGTAFWDRREANLEAQTSRPLHSLVEMGWGGAAGDIDDLTEKMGATDYYPDLFAWTYGTSAITELRIQQALAHFIRAMVSSSSGWDEGYARVFASDAPDRALGADLPNFTREENRGRKLFMTPVEEGGAGCSACHLPPTFALAPNSRSNGLDAGERRLFKAPSLRNVGLTGPYMHDGRFDTLAQVVDFYDRGVQAGPALDPRLRAGDEPQRLGLSAEDRAALVAFLLTLTDQTFIADERFSDPFRRPLR